MLGILPRAQGRCLRLLYKMCGRHALLPNTMNIRIYCDRTGCAEYYGEYADVWKRRYQGRNVAVRVTRASPDRDFGKVIKVSCLLSLSTYQSTESPLSRVSAKRL